MVARIVAMLIAPWIILGTGLLTAADSAAEALKKELARLEGTWEEEPVKGDPNPPVQLEFASGKLTVVWPGQGKLPTKMKVYPDTDPKCIDIEFTKLRNESYEGIYKIDGDTLTLYLASPDVKERPTRFPAKPERGALYGLFRRKKT